MLPRDATMARKLWTEAEIALLRWRFADSRTDDLARALGKSRVARCTG